MHVLSGFLTILLVWCSPAFSKDKFKIGIDGKNPPFSHASTNGELSGFDIDIANAICAELKAECTLTPYKWDNLIPALRGKKIDFAIAALSETRSRKELVAFSDPYILIPSTIIVQKNSILSGVEEDDLRGAQLAALKSSPHSVYIRTHRPETHIRTYEGEKEYFLDLVNGQIDGIVGNPILLNDWLQTEEGSKCCRLLGTLPHDPAINGTGYSIATNIDSTDLLKNLNSVLKRIDKSRSLSKAINTHLPYLQ